MASGDAAREAVKQRTQRGSSGLPKGVTKSGKKYQARINYRPEGKVKKELRGLGSFDSVEQAVQAVAAARAALNGSRIRSSRSSHSGKHAARCALPHHQWQDH